MATRADKRQTCSRLLRRRILGRRVSSGLIRGGRLHGRLCGCLRGHIGGRLVRHLPGTTLGLEQTVELFVAADTEKKNINHPPRVRTQGHSRAAAADYERGAAGAEGGAHRRVGVRSPLLLEHGAGDDGAAWGPPPSLKRAGAALEGLGRRGMMTMPAAPGAQAAPGAERQVCCCWGRGHANARRQKKLLALLLAAAGTSSVAMHAQASIASSSAAVSLQGASTTVGLGLRAGVATGSRSRPACPFDVVSAAGMGIGPAAAATRDGSAIRLRGGAVGSAADAEPNGAVPSYKQVAATGVQDHLNGDEAADEAGGHGDDEDKMVLNVDMLKLEALRKLGASLRLGGRGTARRKFKVVRKKGSKMDDGKIQNSLRKAGLNPIGEIDTIEMIREDGSALFFPSPRLLSNQQANTFCVQGDYEERAPTAQTAAQLAAAEFDQLSDIEKLRRLAAADLPASGADAAAAEIAQAQGSSPGGDGQEGDGEGDAEQGSPEDILAEEEARDQVDVSAGGEEGGAAGEQGEEGGAVDVGGEEATTEGVDEA